MELNFDTEGICYCPKDEVATRLDCVFCRYHKEDNKQNYYCIYENVFPEPVEAK